MHAFPAGSSFMLNGIHRKRDKEHLFGAVKQNNFKYLTVKFEDDSPEPLDWARCKRFLAFSHKVFEEVPPAAEVNH